MKTRLASVLLLGAAGVAAALPDPTLPPAALRAAAVAASGHAAAAPAGAPALRLQGLRTGHSALIDGRLRHVGERWGGHQLLRVEAQAAWLRDAEGRLLRLSLLPATEPRP